MKKSIFVRLADGNTFYGDTYCEIITSFRMNDHESETNEDFLRNIKKRFKTLHNFELGSDTALSLILELQEVGYINEITIRRVKSTPNRQKHLTLLKGE